MKQYAPWRYLLILLTALLIGGCSDSGNDDNAATLTGTVATGAALGGATVEVVDANGVIVTTTTDANGHYEVEVDPDAPPYLVRATSSDGTLTLFSWADADDLNGIVNITDLTTIAVLDAAGGTNAGVPDPDALFDDWSNQNAGFDGEDIDAAAANVNEQFPELGESDIFNDDFEADGTGMDAVLDTIEFELDCDADGNCTVSVKVDEDGDGVFETEDGFDFGDDDGGTGGDDIVLAAPCDTTQFTAGAVHEPTADEAAAYAMTYLGKFGTFGVNPEDPPFTPTGDATLVFDGGLTLNGVVQTVTSICVDNAAPVLYISFGTSAHIDFFGDGTSTDKCFGVLEDGTGIKCDATAGGDGGGTAVPTGTWKLTVSGTVTTNGVPTPISETVVQSDIPAEAVPTDAAGIEDDISTSLETFAGSVDDDVSNTHLTATLKGLVIDVTLDINGAVGDTVTVAVTTDFSVSGTANGITVPPTTGTIDLVYTYERIE